ncbi:hypothetical protein RIF29_25814 [Crotalaria pallida]|uniref:Uncharacterized protein n=1 Tax=Crotalaria pallida TaxID=3830 RepID=A0AAN9EM17_CROPI
MMFSVPNREEELQQEDYAHVVGWRRNVIVQCGRALAGVMFFVLGFYSISVSYRIPNTNDKTLSQGSEWKEKAENLQVELQQCYKAQSWLPDQLIVEVAEARASKA